VLCCAVLCCAVLCCAVLCCAVLCCVVLCCAVLGCVVLGCVVVVISGICRGAVTPLETVQVVAQQCGVVTSQDSSFRCPYGSNFVDANGGLYGPYATSDYFISWCVSVASCVDMSRRDAPCEGVHSRSRVSGQVCGLQHEQVIAAVSVHHVRRRHVLA
jgi:hypothetical protein